MRKWGRPSERSTSYGESLKKLQIFQHHVIPVGHQLPPVRAARVSHRRGDNAEGSRRVVYADVPESIAMVSGVLDVLPTRFDYGPASLRLVRG